MSKTNNMKITYFSVLLSMALSFQLQAQLTNTDHQVGPDNTLHSVLPSDGVLTFLPIDSSLFETVSNPENNTVRFQPMVNFYFRPETTGNYKEAGMKEDTGGLNFFLRGDFGAKLLLPKNIDMVVNLQSYGVYTRTFGPLDPNLTLYEAYVDMKKLNRANTLSLRFGRMCLGKYGTEILVGDDDFIKGRSFESVRLRYKTDRLTSDLMWVQLYQAAPDSVNFDWNHPIFLGYFNTLHFSEGFNLDANLPFLIDQYNSGFRTTVLMPDVRVFGQSGNWRYSLEGIYQTGTAKGIIGNEKQGTLGASAVEVSAGYITTDQHFSADIALYNASGDDQPGDDEIKSYNVLWQNEHRRFGYIDAFKGSNVRAATMHLNYRAGKKVDIGAHAVYASVLYQEDRSTGIATIGNLSSLNTDSKQIGIGGDAYLNYYYNPYFNLQLAGAVFSPGDYFTEVSGIDDTMYRVYLLLALRI